jgi:hypothetical protein
MKDFLEVMAMGMKLVSAVLFCITALSASLVFAGDSLGFVFGSRSPISYKSYLNSQEAFEFNFGYASRQGLALEFNQILRYPGSLKTKDASVNKIVPYVGYGAFYYSATTEVKGVSESRSWLGAQFPLGAEIKGGLPVSFFIEIVPKVSVVPETSVFLEAHLGIRYHF